MRSLTRVAAVTVLALPLVLGSAGFASAAACPDQCGDTAAAPTGASPTDEFFNAAEDGGTTATAADNISGFGAPEGYNGPIAADDLAGTTANDPCAYYSCNLDWSSDANIINAGILP